MGVYLPRETALGVLVSGLLSLGFIAGCDTPSPSPDDPRQALIEKGRRIFFNETFNGNGRTCGTCHRSEANFSINPAFIATLPPNDPLFVAEFTPALKQNFENPRLMREFGLILENLDGFDDPANKFVMRGVPHVLALRTSVASPQGPRTGWSGDGAPGDGSLRSFAVGAVIQHFTRTLDRVAGMDFRLPTDEELDALEAFQLSLGRQQDLALPLPLKGTVARRGQEIFLDNGLGKCNLCHANAGATANFGGGSLGNANFDTGVENLPDQPARLTREKVPRDDGFGREGDGTFNTPPLVEAADSGPFFHNNAIETIEGAVAFYDGDSFNNSPAGQALAKADPQGKGIELDGTQIVAIAAFLRVINALENIRQSSELLEAAARKGFFQREPARTLLERALPEIRDSIRVLTGGGLHPQAAAHLEEARRLARKAGRSFFRRGGLIRHALRELESARAELIEPVQQERKG
jgi:mono/diheme cytochrome c family protein